MACSRPVSQRTSGDLLESLLEGTRRVRAVQVALELGDVALLAIVAAHLVEDFDKHREQGVDLRLADHVGFLVDVEQNALGRDVTLPFAGLPAAMAFVAALGQKVVQARCPSTIRGFPATVPASSAGGLSGAEEAGDPDAVGALVIVVGSKKVLQSLRDLIGEDILFHLRVKASYIVGLDDSFNWAVNGFSERWLIIS